MKVLYVSTIGGFMSFFRYSIDYLNQNGISVDFACNTNISTINKELLKCGGKVYTIHIARTPFSRSNLKAIKELRLIISGLDYEVVHCHTAVAGIVTRLACMGLRKKGLKVLYTPHGLNFSKETSIRNWITFYPIEAIASLFCDGIVGMNDEEYRIMKNRLLCKKVFFVHGVGIDLEMFYSRNTRKETRDKLGITENTCVLISVGELSERKNHEAIINVMPKISNKFVYLIVGEGSLKQELMELSQENRVSDRVVFLGYRKDIPDLLSASDVFVFPSLLEGLPVSLMEAMASGLPCVVSNISGNRDLIDDGKGGYLTAVKSERELIIALEKLIDNESDRRKMGAYNKIRIKKYSYQNVNQELTTIYNSI